MNRTVCWLTLAGTLLCGGARAEELPRLDLSAPTLAATDDGSGEGETGEAKPEGTPAPSRHGGGGGGAGHGSLLSGRTLGANTDAIAVLFGWPGMSLGYLHGQSPDLDFGGTFTFNYGFEGQTQINPGIKLQGALRLKLLDQGRLNLGLRLDPGVTMYFKDIFWFGLTVPVAFALGISVGDALMLNFGVDMPMTIFVTPSTYFELPILMGLGLEYHLDSHLSLLFDARFGPDIWITSGSWTTFSFRTLVGVGYRF